MIYGDKLARYEEIKIGLYIVFKRKDHLNACMLIIKFGLKIIKLLVNLVQKKIKIIEDEIAFNIQDQKSRLTRSILFNFVATNFIE